MKAKTRLQHKVVAANERLLPPTEKQETWAFRHCVSHYAFRTKSGGTTCMDCGHKWNESSKKTCRCPHCGARLEIKDTNRRIYREKAYFSTLTTQDSLQVQRVFLLTANFHKGRKADSHSMEVARYWIDDNGKKEVTALKRSCGYYMDSFVMDGRLELRRDNHVYRHISDCYVYPYYSVIPKLKRNGLKGSLAGFEPTRLIEALLTDSRAETMFKAGRKADLNYFLQHQRDLD
ncbi:MAG: PcfJ-like protein, partial [Prevotellaceae bacterium]|nr:PcfJ-like protein [Prevotellaceae bacterium]